MGHLEILVAAQALAMFESLAAPGTFAGTVAVRYDVLADAIA